MQYVEYIENTGYSYIQTDIPANTDNLKVVFDFMKSQHLEPAGVIGSSWGLAGFFLAEVNSSGGRNMRWHSGGVSVDFYSAIGSVVNYVCERTKITVDDVEYALTNAGQNDTNNIQLFGPVTGGYYRAKGRLYNCKIYSGETLLRDYLPALDNNNVPCLYDEITHTYLYNAGTGSFTPGDPIVPPIPTYTIAFNANGGSGTMPNQTAEIDAYVTLDTCTFVREGYTFIGWSATSTGSVNYADGDTVYNLAAEGETVTLYAVWRKDPPYLIIQENKSEMISLTKELIDILQTPFTLKDETSIIDPVFVINCPLDLLFRANYITAPSLGRKYFIQDIVSMTNDLVELTCHVDVLSTYADEIKANKGIVHRQENNWNLYLNDGVLQTYQNPIITTVEFPNGFTEHNFVAVLAGSRGGGVQIGEGGIAQVTPSVTYNDGGGSGGNENATTAGLLQYAYAQVGEPYWWGTFGNMADANLLDYKRKTQGDYYPNPGDPPFTDQFGHRVHDCVGLIKGYRWRGPFSTADPHYEASQDVDVKGLWNQCIKYRGRLDDASNKPFIGSVVFYDDFTHCGVLVERNVVVEAKGHLFGVVQSQLASRPKFTYWGVPDWMRINTARFSD